MIKRQKEHCLVLRRAEANNINYYYRFVETNCSIGRHANCEVQVEDENVDAYHCKIFYRHPHFYLKNTSMAHGTYHKVISKVPVKNGMVAEMGSHLFSFILATGNKLKVNIILGDNSGETFLFDSDKRRVLLGRKSTNDINIGTDSHLSNLHSRLIFEQNQWFLEDLGTTNGTWIMQEN